MKSRRLAAGTVWYRIGHHRYGTALHFSTGAVARWNDPLDTYGVLYVADAPATAFAETFGPLAQWQCRETGGDILDILDAQGWGLV